MYQAFLKQSKFCSKAQSGNALFIILIAVALFATLSYAVTSSSRSGDGVDEELATLDQAELENYQANIDLAVKRLIFAKCGSNIDYTPPSEQLAGDKSCHVFHVQGGGAYYRANLGLGAGCLLSVLDPGEKCAGIIYIGSLSGTRLYTTTTDQGQYTWNNGTSNWSDTSALSLSDGLANTNLLIALEDTGAPYAAVNVCRTLGEEWYLPAEDELVFMYNNKDIIGGFSSSNYWSSTEVDDDTARTRLFSTGQRVYRDKDLTFPVRCMRK